MLLFLGSGLAICIKLQEVHWWPCQLTHLFYSTEGLLIMGPYPIWVKWWHGCMNSWRAWRYMSEMYWKKNLTRVPFPSCSKSTGLEQPEGFEIHDQESHVCRLKKALYDLELTPWAWYERIDSCLMKLRFTRSEADPNHCLKVVDDRPLTLVPYEDDLFLTGADPLICKSKRELDSIFGLVNYKPWLPRWSLTLRSYAVVMPELTWEMPLSFINSY